MSHEEIALAIGIARATLEKYFAAELSQGALSKRLEVMQAIHAAALKGNVAAGKAYLSGSPPIGVPPAPDKPKPEDPPRDALGKKAQANEDAKTAQVGTGWNDLLPANVGTRLQ